MYANLEILPMKKKKFYLSFLCFNSISYVSLLNPCSDGSCFIYVCVCLRILLANTYCVVLLLCLSSSGVPCVASFSGLSMLDCPFGIL